MSGVKQLTGVNRWKLALIPVLGAVLLAVLMGGDKKPSTTEAPITLATPEEIAAIEPESSTPSIGIEQNWPRVNLEQLVQRSPFDPLPEPKAAVPEPVAETARVDAVAAEKAAAASAAAKVLPPVVAKVRAIYQAGGERIALVDSRVVRVGDELAGRRVIEITPTEVVLQRPD